MGATLPRRWRRPRTALGQRRTTPNDYGRRRSFPTVDAPLSSLSAFEHGDAGRAVHFADQRLSRALGHQPDGVRQEGGGRPESEASDRPGPLAVAENGGPDSRVHRRTGRGLGRWTRSASTPATPETDQEAASKEEEQDDDREPERTENEPTDPLPAAAGRDGAHGPVAEHDLRPGGRGALPPAGRPGRACSRLDRGRGGRMGPRTHRREPGQGRSGP